MRKLALFGIALSTLGLAAGCCNYGKGSCGSCNSCGSGAYGVPGGYAPTYGTPYGAAPAGAYYVPSNTATAAAPVPYSGYPTTATVPTESLPTY